VVLETGEIVSVTDRSGNRRYSYVS